MAHSVQEMRMCEAFAETGGDVTYLHGHRFTELEKVSWDDVADHYGLSTRFTIKTFRNFYGKPEWFTKFGTLSMALPIALYMFMRVLHGGIGQEDVIYGRNYYALLFLVALLRLTPWVDRPPIVFEYHQPNSPKFRRWFFSQVDGVVCITERLAQYTSETFAVGRDEILVEPDGVDHSSYEGQSQANARDELGLDPEEDIVMYTSHCYEGKGVETLVQSACGLDANVYVVGGYDEDIDRVKREIGHPENVIFTGFVQPSDIPTHQVAADVLVAPYTEESRPWVSPLKLFEYMAAGHPIVASDREVLREVLTDGQNAVIFEQGNADALRDAILSVLESDTLRATLVTNAEKTVDQYTWNNRARRILEWARRLDSEVVG